MAETIGVPEEVIHFRNELRNHPELYKAAAILPTFEEIIGHVAAQYGMAINGSFDYDEMRVILATLTKLMYESRQVILLTGISTPATPH